MDHGGGEHDQIGREDAGDRSRGAHGGGGRGGGGREEAPVAGGADDAETDGAGVNARAEVPADTGRDEAPVEEEAVRLAEGEAADYLVRPRAEADGGEGDEDVDGDEGPVDV